MPTDDPTPHILILWKPKYNTEDLENAEYLYISEESRDRLSIVRGIYNNELQLRPSNIWVTEWMVKKLNRALLCNSINRTWELNIPIQIINNERINIAKPIKVRSNIVRGKQPERNEKIKFAVGMIVTHSLDLYLYSRRHIHATNINHDGIIIGWHDKCWQMSINKSLDSMFP